jgi:hypothetical protein
MSAMPCIPCRTSRESSCHSQVHSYRVHHIRWSYWPLFRRMSSYYNLFLSILRCSCSYLSRYRCHGQSTLQLRYATFRSKRWTLPAMMAHKKAMVMGLANTVAIPRALDAAIPPKTHGKNATVMARATDTLI